MLFEIKPTAAGLEASEVWSNTTQGYMSSPVIIDGYAYFHLRSERVRCLDLKTGEIRWTSQPYERIGAWSHKGTESLDSAMRHPVLIGA